MLIWNLALTIFWLCS